MISCCCLEIVDGVYREICMENSLIGGSIINVGRWKKKGNKLRFGQKLLGPFWMIFWKLGKYFFESR